MQLTLVCWYVACMLLAIVGCSVWVMLCQCKVIPLKYGSFVWPYRSLCNTIYLLPTYLFFYGGISWLTPWRCWLHSCWMFILIVEYGLVHWGDCINCETHYFCFDLCLSCKPFLGVCTQTGRWCMSVVATRSLYLFTDRADSCSQISSLDSWCTACLSKTLDLVQGYMLC